MSFTLLITSGAAFAAPAAFSEDRDYSMHSS